MVTDAIHRVAAVIVDPNPGKASGPAWEAAGLLGLKGLSERE